MYLKKIAIINYKSCRDLILELNEDSPNTFIGQSDSGKSTILKAVGLLLNDKNTPNLMLEGHETSDISTTTISKERYKQIFDELKLPNFEIGEDKTIIILGIFKKQDGDFEGDFDESASNQLMWSIESFSGDEVAIIRQFNSQYPSGRYLLCLGEDNKEKRELWKQNQSSLDTLIKEYKITNDDIVNCNKSGRFKNLEKFRAIYSKLEITGQWSQFDDFVRKDRKYFPLYRYVDWREITLKGVEELARDTMFTVIEEYSNTLKAEADRLSKIATQKVNSELEKKTSTILSGMPSVTAIKARVFFKSDETISEISVEKGTSDGNVRLESQGDGIQKQIGFAFMRLAALEKVTEEQKVKKYIWGFDEPEAHLYPPEKRDFYETIKQLSNGVFQTLISTHSTVFVDKSLIETIRNVQLYDKYTKVTMCSSVSDIYESLGIKNSDFLFYDTFIAGEGDSDKTLIPHFYKLYFDSTFEDDSIQFVSLGGGSRWSENKKLFAQILADFKDPKDCVYYILDGDTHATGDKVFLVGKYDIEDSIGDTYWITLVKDRCGIDLTDDDMIELRKDLSSNSDKKFHKLLSDKVETFENKTEHLPSKTDCAKFMTEYITTKDGIPVDLIKLFESIKR